MSAAPNKFLIGYGAFVGLGVIALGYLAFSASGRNDEAATDFDTKQGVLTGLQNAKPFPNFSNQKATEAERDKLVAGYQGLQKTLAAAEFPYPDLQPTTFQQELDRVLKDFMAKAPAAKVEFPDKDFNLGFNYLGQLPEADAAKSIGRQLKVVEWLMARVIETKEIKIVKVGRSEFPEEKGKKADAEAKPSKDGKGELSSEKKLISRSKVTLNFVTDQGRARILLNSIAACKEQFLIIRRVAIKNTGAEAPKKEVAAVVPTPQPAAPTPSENPQDTPAPSAPATPAQPGTPVAPPAPVTPALSTPTAPTAAAPTAPPAAAVEPPKLAFIFGNEKIEVEVEIEFLDFAEPPVAPAKRGGK